MAITTNGIATELETYDKLNTGTQPGDFSPDRLVTKSRVISGFGGCVDERTNTYGYNLCVRFEDIWPTKLYNFYDNLVDEYAVRWPGYEENPPDGNERLDANFAELGEYCAYTYLDMSQYCLFYEYADFCALDYADPQWGDGTFFSRPGLVGGLYTISNCGWIKASHHSYIRNLSFPGDSGILSEFNLGTYPYWLSYTRRDATSNGPVGLSLADRLWSKNTGNGPAVVMCGMREGQLFDFIFKTTSIRETLELAAFVRGYYTANTIYDGPVQPWGAHPLNATEYIFEVPLTEAFNPRYYVPIYTRTATPHEIFRVYAFYEYSLAKDTYYITIRFIKHPTDWRESPVYGYYLTDFMANIKTEDSELELIHLDYTRFSAAGSADSVNLWFYNDLTTDLHAMHTGLDSSALYSISFIDSLTKREGFKLELDTGVILNTSCCIVDPTANGHSHAINVYLPGNLLENPDQLALTYTRAVETNHVVYNDSSSAPTYSSFVHDTYLNHGDDYSPNFVFSGGAVHPTNECYLVFACGTQKDPIDLPSIIGGIVNKSPSSISPMIQSFGTLNDNNILFLGVPESVFFNTHDYQGPHTKQVSIDVVDFPRAVRITNGYFGQIISELSKIVGNTSYNEFYIYYKTHYYHYKINWTN